jgi:hypothetical protein
MFPPVENWAEGAVNRLLDDIEKAGNPNHDADPGDCTDHEG